ncbi:MAG: aminotransferase class III-fold pyridoxal phosphate-dependent enzyme [Pirellulales bacterium]|nr:aminotransferase class III-fold pyridoxal phosphate-dependent enzyme [Pirellulales bacterium]
MPRETPPAAKLEYLARDQAALIHSQHQAELAAKGMVWLRGAGTTLYDSDGRGYLDGLSGLWNVLVGHGREELAAAAALQMRELAFCSSFCGATHPRAIELAEHLQQLLKLPDWRFFFTTGGNEAVETALKTARYYWRRLGHPDKTQFLCFDKAYHGTSLATASATASAAYQTMFAPTLPGMHILFAPARPEWHVTYSDPPVDPFGEDGSSAHIAPCVAQDLKQLEQAIVRIGPGQLAAILAEPIWAAGGTHVPYPSYWNGVRELCDRYQLLWIADEVITGFGRTATVEHSHHWLAVQHARATPDMVCLAKGITSGYFPLGGMGMSPLLAEQIHSAPPDQAWWHAVTASAHPVGCAVALANLELLEREQLIPRAAQLAEELQSLLCSKFAGHAHVGQIRTAGLLAGVEFVARRGIVNAQGELTSDHTPFAPELRFGKRLLRAARERGLISRVRGDTFQLAPPYVTTRAEMEQMVEILAIAAAEVSAALSSTHSV